MAHHAGYGSWWTPPPGTDGGGAGHGIDSRSVRDLITAMGASVVNTNQNVVALGQMLAQNSQSWIENS